MSKLNYDGSQKIIEDFNLVENNTEFTFDYAELLLNLKSLLVDNQKIAFNFFLLNNFLQTLRLSYESRSDEVGEASFRIFNSINEILYNKQVVIDPDFNDNNENEKGSFLMNESLVGIYDNSTTLPMAMIEAQPPVDDYIEEVSSSLDVEWDFPRDDLLIPSLSESVEVEVLPENHKQIEFLNSDVYNLIRCMFRSSLNYNRTRVKFYTFLYDLLFNKLLKEGNSELRFDDFLFEVSCLSVQESQLFNLYCDHFQKIINQQEMRLLKSLGESERFLDESTKVFLDFIQAFNDFFANVLKLNFHCKNGNYFFRIEVVSKINAFRFNGLSLNQISQSEQLIDFLCNLSSISNEKGKYIVFKSFQGKFLNKEEVEFLNKNSSTFNLNQFSYKIEGIGSDSYKIIWEFNS